MEAFFSHDYVYTAGVYSIVVISLIIALAVFEWVTRYKTWEQIQQGNLSVALATAGKIFGVANVFRHSIMVNDSVLAMLGWGAYGFILLIFVYFIFEFLTPRFKVDEELAKNNKAVGLLSFILSVALSYIIGASIG
jgi:putative membrane protein